MRFVLATALAGFLAVPGHADTMKNCAAAWKAKTPDAVAAKSYKAWSAKCLDADYSVVPPAPPAPDGATAMCKDGTYSLSKAASGRCSHHGGVAKIL
jgi:hypothetical protein